jgi:hypothetical protein
MFLGHVAAGLAAKKFAPKTSLGTLLIATNFEDLIWALLCLLGIKHVAVSPGDAAYWIDRRSCELPA